MWRPLTMTYIFKVIRPWLWKSCPLCSIFSSSCFWSVSAAASAVSVAAVLPTLFNFLGKPLKLISSNHTWLTYGCGKFFWHPFRWPWVKVTKPPKRSAIYLVPTVKVRTAHLFFSEFFCKILNWFSPVELSICHILGMVGPIDVKQKGNEWTGCYAD